MGDSTLENLDFVPTALSSPPPTCLGQHDGPVLEERRHDHPAKLDARYRTPPPAVLPSTPSLLPHAPPRLSLAHARTSPTTPYVAHAIWPPAWPG